MSFTPKKVKVGGKTAKRETDGIIPQAVDYIRRRYDVQFNPFHNSYTIVEKLSKNPATLQVSDLRLVLKNAGISLSTNMLFDMLKSRLPEFRIARDFHPVREFLNTQKSLYKGTSHIDLLASYINPRPFHAESVEKFRYYFKKWFVSMVATAMGQTSNDVMFILIQAEGGTGKSRFIEYLASTLTDFIKVLTKNNYRTDLLSDIVRNIIVVFDELAALPARYIQTFKSEISQRSVKKQFAYTQQEVILDRLASFAGTTNFSQEKGGFIELYDKGLMRRFFSIENIGVIDWTSYIEKVDVNQMYAEAMTLISNSAFDYKFNNVDFQYFESENRRYIKRLELSEVVQEFFMPAEVAKEYFYTSAEVRDMLIQKNFPPKLITEEAIGKVLSNLDFPKTEEHGIRVERFPTPRKGYFLKQK